MFRIALRLLLGLLLVLNGTGYAAAATQMQMAHIAMALTAHEAASNPPCHDAAPRGTTATSMHSHGDTANDKDGAGVPSCCQSSLCSCDCLQHATAAMGVVVIAADAPPAADIAQLGVVHRVAPPLPNLLRPPIA